MTVLDGIRATGKQKLKTAASNGDLIEITLYFLPASQNWKMDVVYNDFELYGFRVCNLPNLLCQFSNVIPFGMACTVSDGGEPFLINDFSGGRCELIILDSDEVEAVETACMEGTFLE